MIVANLLRYAEGLTDNPRLQVDAWPVITGLGGDINNPTYTAVSALYASHPNESDARNFGETCRRIAKGDGNDIVDSMDKRFRRLLACGEQEEGHPATSFLDPHGFQQGGKGEL